MTETQELIAQSRDDFSEVVNQWSDEYEPRRAWEMQVSDAIGAAMKSTAALYAALEHLVAERDAVVHDTRRLLVERDAATRAWEESSHAMDQWRAKALAAEDRLDAAVAAEREACALIALKLVFDDHALAQATEYGRGSHETAIEITSSIRARNAGSGE